MTSELKGVLEELKSKQLVTEENYKTINTRLTDFFNAGNRRFEQQERDLKKFQRTCEDNLLNTMNNRLNLYMQDLNFTKNAIQKTTHEQNGRLVKCENEQHLIFHEIKKCSHEQTEVG